MTETGAAACIKATHEPRQVGTQLLREAGLGRGGAPGRRRRAATVDDGVPGELLVRAAGPDPRRHFFSGYLKDETATEQAWAGGWFHTGDVVTPRRRRLRCILSTAERT
jgi:long-subunit acyl-CoA synthetase (AMP-forming)